MRPLEDDSCLDLRLLRKSGTEEGKIKRKKKKKDLIVHNVHPGIQLPSLGHTMCPLPVPCYL